MKERWGKEIKYKQDWKVVNENLVVRGEFLLDMSWVKNWNKELHKMNEGKRGAPYQFPESLIKLQAIWGQWLDYRGLKGVTRQLYKHGLIPQYNDYSTIYRRVIETEIKFELPKDKNIFVSADGSGMKITNGGTYREEKYGKHRRKCAKLVISADPYKKKLLACEVHLEGDGDSEQEIAFTHLKELTELGFNIKQFWGDPAFDTLNLFNFLAKHKIKSAIKPSKPRTCDREKSKARKKEVEEYNKLGYKGWAREREYGRRWTGTEGIFSAIKRKFGENSRSLIIGNIYKEIKRRCWAYDQMKNYAEARQELCQRKV